MLERGGRSGGGGGGSRRAAEASPMTPSDDDFDGNETMSMVSNCSDMQTAAQLTDGEYSVFVFLSLCVVVIYDLVCNWQSAN